MNRTVFLSDLTSHSYGSRTPSAPAKEASRHFIDGAATPPNLGGEFRVTFRVHDHSRNEVQKLETPMRTPLLTTSEKMANLQAALYERRQFNNCDIVGGHRPPLQSGRQSVHFLTYLYTSFACTAAA